MDLVELADRKARFALMIMGALNVAFFFVATRTDLVNDIPDALRPFLAFYLMVYASVALFFFLEAIESLRPRRFRPAPDLPRRGGARALSRGAALPRGRRDARPRGLPAGVARGELRQAQRGARRPEPHHGPHQPGQVPLAAPAVRRPARPDRARRGAARDRGALDAAQRAPHGERGGDRAAALSGRPDAERVGVGRRLRAHRLRGHLGHGGLRASGAAPGRGRRPARGLGCRLGLPPPASLRRGRPRDAPRDADLGRGDEPLAGPGQPRRRGRARAERATRAPRREEGGVGGVRPRRGPRDLPLQARRRRGRRPHHRRVQPGLRGHLVPRGEGAPGRRRLPSRPSASARAARRDRLRPALHPAHARRGGRGRPPRPQEVGRPHRRHVVRAARPPPRDRREPGPTAGADAGRADRGRVPAARRAAGGARGAARRLAVGGRRPLGSPPLRRRGRLAARRPRAGRERRNGAGATS